MNLPEMKMCVFSDVEMSPTLRPLKMRRRLLKMRYRLLKMRLNHRLLKTGLRPRLLKMRRRLCKQWVWSQETLAMLSGGYKRLEKSICLHRLSRKSNKYQMSAHVEFYRTKLGFNQSSQNQSPQTMDHVFQWYVCVIICKGGIALCVDPHCKVSIGQYTKMCTSPLILRGNVTFTF